MKDDEDGAPAVTTSVGYADAQWWKAFATSLAHDDPQVRARAEQRAHRWTQVVAGMLAGTLRIGSRTPVAGLPAWATPVVVRGGFATGEAAAGGPFTAAEHALAAASGTAPQRADLFAHLLSPQGLATLGDLLDSGAYRVDVPEEAALLAVAWLVRAGDLDAAAAVVRQLEPHAATLRFAPVPEDRPAPPADVVWRQTAGEAAAQLSRRRESPRIAAMNEALAVWAPFTDELLALWLETVVDGRLGAVVPDGWVARAVDALGRYEELALAHRPSRRYCDPKENLGILRTALADAVAAHPAPPPVTGLLRHAVDAMVAKRGTPGAATHAALRAEQARVAALPTNAALARVVAERLGAVPQDAGVPDPDAVLDPVDGRPVPASVARTVRRATAGTVERLVGLGVVPSAEVLAELVPQVTATVVADAYPDPALRTLVAATYRAFRARRSLLLLDLASQVRFDELPWVRALEAHRAPDAAADVRRATAVRLARLAVESFPATVLPNPFVAELATLLGPEVPLTEELAADIFMGAFSPKFTRAAVTAARVVEGSLYARYYDVPVEALLGLPAAASRATGRPGREVRGDPYGGLARLAARRAGVDLDGPGWTSVAENGRVIEQAQVLTTHNLATLVDLGVVPAAGWGAPARGAFEGVVRWVGLAGRQEHPRGALKNAAYALRQAVFFLSRGDEAEVDAFAGWARDRVRACPAAVDRARLDVVLDGLDAARAGRPVQPLYGWTTGPHPLLQVG